MIVVTAGLILFMICAGVLVLACFGGYVLLFHKESRSSKDYDFMAYTPAQLEDARNITAQKIRNQSHNPHAAYVRELNKNL